MDGLAEGLGNLPNVDNTEDMRRLQGMILRIQALENEPDAPPLPPALQEQLAAMKDEIGSLQAEMDAIRLEVADAVRTITQETAAMVTQVRRLETDEAAGPEALQPE